MKIVALIALSLSILLSGCTTNPYSGERQMAKSAKYGSLTAVAGGVVGALLGGKQGAFIGAGLGAAAGGGYGYYTDVQEKNLREQMAAQNAAIEVSRNQDNQLMVSMPSDVTFQSGSAEINPANYQALTVIANTVRQRQGKMVIIGNTDNTGSLQLNQSLSLARANGVANYMFAQGVPVANIHTDGMAYHKPIASNDTPQGRAMNRRVEIILQ